MGLCGSFRCGCGITSTPAASGAIDGELPSIVVSGSGEPGDPYDLSLNDAWAIPVADFINNVKAAEVATSQTTTSTSYVDLATVGPQVTCKTGTSALVFAHALMETTGLASAAIMSVAVSGATTVAASDDRAVSYLDGSSTAGTNSAYSGMILFTGLTAGNNTFTVKYRTTAGATGVFINRRIAVVPLL